MHPLVWVVWAVAGLVAAGTTTNPAYLAVIAAAAWLVHAVHGQGRAFRGFALAAAAALVLRTLLVLVLLLAPGGSLGLGNVLSAALEGARLATILVVVGAFNSVADPFGVLRLAPGRLYEAALAAALALQIAPRTVAAIGRVREAQRMRGIEVRARSWRSRCRCSRRGWRRPSCSPRAWTREATDGAAGRACGRTASPRPARP